MRLEKFKEKDNKRIGIVVFTVVCILLVSGVILYRTFAIFEVNNNFNVINGSVEDPGDIYFAFYKDEQIQKDMPKKEEGYVLDESKSYCGVTGGNDSNVKVFVTEDNMIHVSGVTTSRTKCNLYFVRGVYILGKGVPIVESGEGLYEVKHDDVTEINEGFKTTEYRYAGKDPNNYIKFNDELWRIIGLVNVMIDETHVEQRVKIVRNESIQNVQWNDNIHVNDWNQSSLMKLLNTGDYYNREGEYGTTGLTENAKEKIDNSILWNLGGCDTSNILVNDIYQYERSSNVLDNNNYLWSTNNHGVALIYPSDYGYAVGGANDKRKKCFEETHLNALGSCTDENWLYLKNEYVFEWLLTHNTWKKSDDNSTFVFTINKTDNGRIAATYASVNYNQNISQFRPTLYLKTNVKILNEGQIGSAISPFQLVQILK